jgi:hypothetical protein
MSRSLISARYISLCLNFICMSSLTNINNCWLITNNEIQGNSLKYNGQQQTKKIKQQL